MRTTYRDVSLGLSVRVRFWFCSICIERETATEVFQLNSDYIALSRYWIYIDTKTNHLLSDSRCRDSVLNISQWIIGTSVNISCCLARKRGLSSGPHLLFLCPQSYCLVKIMHQYCIFQLYIDTMSRCFNLFFIHVHINRESRFVIYICAEL